MNEVLNKYKDVIPYIFFGVCTTLVNMIVCWLCAHVFLFSVMISTIVAWVVSVLFAYVTNRKIVFHSAANGLVFQIDKRQEQTNELF